MNRSNNFRNGIFLIFGANIINLGFKLFIKFVQPYFLSIETYSQIQTYTLYMTYVAVLHCGFIDGMYLKYGGKKLSVTDLINVKKDLANLRGLLIVITFLLIIPAFLFNDSVVFFCIFSLLPANIIVYYQMLFQAVGEFKNYGKIMNYNTILHFIGTFICVFILGSDSYVIYIVMECIVYILLAVMLEFRFRREFYNFDNISSITFKVSEISSYIKLGLPLTIGGISSMVFMSLDRWFVKVLLGTIDFAIYSFAISLEGFLNIAINPIILTLYNHLCNHRTAFHVQKLRKIVLIFSALIVSAAFPACFFITYFLVDYSSAKELIYTLFAAKMINIVIRGIYDNLYKVDRRQYLYLKRIIYCIVIGIIANYMGYIIYPHMISFSIATLLTMFIWIILCINDFKDINWAMREGLFLIITIISLISCGCFMNPIIGFFIYVCIVMGSSSILLKDSLCDFAKILLRKQ